jgi:hypothetical protein
MNTTGGMVSAIALDYGGYAAMLMSQLPLPVPCPRMSPVWCRGSQ